MRRRHALVPTALALACALTLAACGDDSDGSSDTTTTTAASGDTTTTTEAVAPPVAIWPGEDADPYESDTDAALAFAREFLGMPEASLSEDTDTVSGAVGIRPYAESGPTTFVEVDERDPGWVVTGASTEYVVVDSPLPGSAVSTPVTVSGSGTANEGNIALQARPLGSSAALASTFATAGALGEMGPFEAVLEFETSADVVVIVVYLPDDSDAGMMLSAAAFAVAIG